MPINPNSIDISLSSRAVEPNFTQVAATTNVGPARVSTTTQSGPGIKNNGQNIIVNQGPQSLINQWSVITAGDAGLQAALYNFINTTEAGQTVAPDTVNGRTKTMTFTFYGTIGQILAPGEVGGFKVKFSYSPNTIQ